MNENKDDGRVTASLGSQWPRTDIRLDEFQAAILAVPWVAERIAAGEQFNVYQSADNDEDDDPDDWHHALCIGPITDHRFICPIVGHDRALLVETALKVATEALRERLAQGSQP